MEKTTDRIEGAARHISSRLAGRVPQVGIVLGSGLGKLADTIEDATVIPYRDIPGFPVSTAIGHKGSFIVGTLGGKSVAGVILMLIIFPVGHAISFALNALGAYVHTLRLQYVELFSKFYEGGGRQFKPFNRKSKFTRLKEDK